MWKWSKEKWEKFVMLEIENHSWKGQKKKKKGWLLNLVENKYIFKYTYLNKHKLKL